MNPNIRFVLQNQKDFLKFLKSRYKLFHLSNIFFRDIHYGLMGYLQMKGTKASYGPTESQSRELIVELEKLGVLKTLDDRTWLLEYPEFKLIQPKPPVKASPAPAGLKAPVPTAAPAPRAE